MIQLSNGHVLEFACGSGALGFDGCGWWWEQPLRWMGLLDPRAFTVVAKTVTRHPRKGNLSMWHPWTCVRTFRHGSERSCVNAVGLTNPGIEAWIARDYPRAKKRGYKVAASIWPQDPPEAEELAAMLSHLELAYVELNLSCPNTKEARDSTSWMDRSLDILGGVFANCAHPLVLKLAEKQLEKEFIELVDSSVEAYHAINTIPWDDMYGHHPVERPSPLQKYKHGLKGGVSGPVIRDRAVKSVKRLSKMTDKPIIGGGGITTLKDLAEFEKAGASAFSIGTLFLTKPREPNNLVHWWRVRRMLKEMFTLAMEKSKN